MCVCVCDVCSRYLSSCTSTRTHTYIHIYIHTQTLRGAAPLDRVTVVVPEVSEYLCTFLTPLKTHTPTPTQKERWEHVCVPLLSPTTQTQLHTHIYTHTYIRIHTQKQAFAGVVNRGGRRLFEATNMYRVAQVCVGVCVCVYVGMMTVIFYYVALVCRCLSL